MDALLKNIKITLKHYNIPPEQRGLPLNRAFVSTNQEAASYKLRIHQRIIATADRNAETCSSWLNCFVLI